MKLLVIILLFVFVFFVGYFATGGVDRFIKKNCSPKGFDLDLDSLLEPYEPPPGKKKASENKQINKKTDKRR